MLMLQFYLCVQANEDITQIVKVMYSDNAKWTWLMSNLVQFTTGQVLIPADSVNVCFNYFLFVKFTCLRVKSACCPSLYAAFKAMRAEWLL